MSDYFGVKPICIGDWDEPVFYYSSEEEGYEINRPEILPKKERDRLREKIIANAEEYVEFESTSEIACKSVKCKYPALSLEEKIKFYKKSDKFKIGKEGDIDMEFVLKQMDKQKGICYICKDKVLLTGTAGCRYLISIDRIDNDSPHDRNNCLIACNYCNCRKYMKEVHGKDFKKVCTNGCHALERDLPKKETILKQLINENIPVRFTW